MSVSGIEAFLELLHSAGVRYIFGNPGTTELPLNDALAADTRFDYILGLQEVPVMAMADGYAMASGQLGVVNLHACCGLGNAMGMLYNAYREGTPLLVTAGQQDRRLKSEEPILAGDMVSVARPWTKWSVEVNRIEDLPNTIRRAIQTARTPPTGPVFVSMPVDLQMETSDALDLTPARVPDRGVRPPSGALREAAERLASARAPAILAGSRVTEAQAERQLVAVAERLGAPVYFEPGTTHGRLPFPCDHPLCGQGLPLWSPEIVERLTAFDVLLVVGMDLFRLYIHREPSRPIPPHVRLVQLDEDPWQLGKNYPLDVAMVGDTRTGLTLLADELGARMTSQQQSAARERSSQWAARHARTRAALQQSIADEPARQPMSARQFMHALARVLPENAAVVEEAVTTTGTLLERLGALKNTTGYFGHRGWALGWGLGCALGAQLAWPHRRVLGILGEGSIMYGIQGLWSAAHYSIPATIVVPNNAQYQILKVCAQQLGLRHAAQDRLVALDVRQPEIDLVTLVTAMGVDACRVEDPDSLSDAVRRSLNNERPTLIDVPIERRRPGALAYG